MAATLSIQARAEAELERRKRTVTVHRLRETEADAPSDVLSFRDFIARVNPRYQFYRHAEQLIEVLQHVADGEIRRLMVFMPPRHGKSELCSRLLPAYFLHRHPERFVGLASYGADLSYGFSRNARANFEEIGGRLASDAAAVKYWATAEGGGMWAAGVGGPITGRGYHCFPAGTRIQTEEGAYAIEHLCSLENPPRVLSFNHARERLEWQRIVSAATQTRNDLVEVEMASGRRLRCTSDHPVYVVGSGYREAGDLLPGQAVIEVSQVQNVRGVLRPYGPGGPLQSVLHRRSTDHLSHPVCSVPHGLHEGPCGRDEVDSFGADGLLLQSEMQRGGPRREEQEDVRAVRSPDRDQAESVLQGVSSTSVCTETRLQAVQAVQRGVSTDFASDEVLLPSLCQSSALRADALEGEQPLQERQELRPVVQANAPDDSSARRGPVRSLRQPGSQAHHAAALEGGILPSAIHAPHSPHQRGSGGQPGREPCDPVQPVPQAAPLRDGPWETGTVSRVVRLRGASERVYDLQVEGSHNFFAEGVLVHNCGIVDDPIKDAEQALSEKVRGKQKDWWDSTWATREEPGGAQIVMLTRWHEDDLAGWLLEREKQEASDPDGDPDRWHIVCMEAIRTPTPPAFPETCALEPDVREEGEALCPERVSLRKLKKAKKRSAYWFGALFQQKPSPDEGGLWKRAWFEREEAVFDTEPVNADGTSKLRSVGYDFDTAHTADEANAACAYVKTGVDEEGTIYVLDLDWRWIEFPDQVTWMKALKGPHYIEAKSTGKSAKQSLDRQGVIAIEVPVTGGDKVARTTLATPVAEAGKLRVRRSLLSRLLDDEKQGILKFPNGSHADLGDALVQAIARHGASSSFEVWDDL